MVCRKCSTYTHNPGEFCPHCGSFLGVHVVANDGVTAILVSFSDDLDANCLEILNQAGEVEEQKKLPRHQAVTLMDKLFLNRGEPLDHSQVLALSAVA